MKLINCETGQIETERDWVDGKLPPYAILSHTWATGVGPSEVTYQDYMTGREAATRNLNWAKIDGAIEVTQAGQERLNYLWIDSCCIDKTIDSELSESINSMFRWYSEAVVCYTHIADLECQLAASVKKGAVNHDSRLSEREKNHLRNCKWFTRGWTLQELIAPPRVEFFDKNWTGFGSRNELSDILSDITGIDQEVLQDPVNPMSRRDPGAILRRMTVAKRMSWAQSRQTSKTEDIAYSLLGIFDVNMPMLYGEGAKAFIRLQKEIMVSNNDLTLFAWQVMPPEQREKSDASPPTIRGILAESPREFANAGDLLLSDRAKFNPDFAITNKGLKITTQLRKIPDQREDLFLGLNCYQRGQDPSRSIGISVRFRGAAGYVRTRPDLLFAEGNDGAVLPETSIYIALQQAAESDARVAAAAASLNKQSFRFSFGGKMYYDILHVSHKEMWHHGSDAFITHGMADFAGCVFFKSKGAAGEPVGREFVVACGFAGDSATPWVCVGSRLGPLYRSAAAQDWAQMRTFGSQLRTPSIRARYPGPDRRDRLSGLEVTAAIDRMVLEGDEVFHVSVNADRFDDATLSDEFCIGCCTSPTHGGNECVIL